MNVKDVVKEVGVTLGAFYHYFKSREELIAGVMYKFFEDDNPFLLADKQKGLKENKDGSMNVLFPKQVSQTIALLAASWLSPYAFEVPYEEYADKVLFFEQLTADNHRH